MKASALRRFGSIAPSGRGITLGALDHAYRYGRTNFPSRVFDPSEVGRVLKTGHQSRKIGKTVMKGHRKGWPIFTLTLEERATCPRSCLEWAGCYGNNMQAAERITPGAELEQALSVELAALQRIHPAGFLIRLHVLGDFYSAGYVGFWRDALERFPALHVFGFTARPPGTEIGDALAPLINAQWGRFAVRYSGGSAASKSAEVVGPGGESQGILCPAQTGATDCCATCALCWQSDRSIAFRGH
jgi:hypothetical protein